MFNNEYKYTKNKMACNANAFTCEYAFANKKTKK